MIEFRDGTEQQWHEMFAMFDEATFPQAWQWGDMQTSLGHKAVRQIIYRNNTACGLFLAIVKHTKRGRFIEVPCGPLIDWTDAELVAAVMAELRAVAHREHCISVRLRPQVEDSPALRALLAKNGLAVSPMYLSADNTSMLNLTQSEDELLAAMRKQTRYEINRSGRRGVNVTQSTAPETVDAFHSIQADTARRQGFVPPSEKYLQACLAAMGSHARIYRADKNGQLLNLVLVIFYGQEAVYFEAASTPEARNEPGAYAIIWQIIRDAKADGMTRLNLWGTAPADQPNHRFAGVTTFKRGFGGRDITFIPAHDIIVAPLRYRIIWLVETLRRKWRHV